MSRRNRISFEHPKVSRKQDIENVRNAIHMTADELMDFMDIRKKSFDRMMDDLGYLRSALQDLKEPECTDEDRLCEAECTLNCMSTDTRAQFKINFDLGS